MATVLDRMKTMPLSFEPKPEPQVPTMADLTKMMTELMTLYQATLLALQKTNPSKEVTVSSSLADIRKSLGLVESPTNRVYTDHQIMMEKLYERMYRLNACPADPLLSGLQECTRRSAELERRFEQLEAIAITTATSSVTQMLIDKAYIRLAADIRQHESNIIGLKSKMMMKADAENTDRYFEPSVYEVFQCLSADLERAACNVNYSAAVLGSTGVSDIVDTILLDGTAPEDWSATVSVAELEAAIIASSRHSYQPTAEKRASAVRP